MEDHILHHVVALGQRGSETNLDVLKTDCSPFDGVKDLFQVFYTLCQLGASL